MAWCRPVSHSSGARIRKSPCNKTTRTNHTSKAYYSGHQAKNQRDLTTERWCALSCGEWIGCWEFSEKKGKIDSRVPDEDDQEVPLEWLLLFTTIQRMRQRTRNSSNILLHQQKGHLLYLSKHRVEISHIESVQNINAPLSSISKIADPSTHYISRNIDTAVL